MKVLKTTSLRLAVLLLICSKVGWCMEIAEEKYPLNYEIYKVKCDSSLQVVLPEPPKDEDGYYMLSEGNHDKNHLWEAGLIAAETQAKRLCRWMFGSFTNHYDYFSKNELANGEVYEFNEPSKHDITGITLQHISHASQLIQAEGFNILTDPVFGDIQPWLYPAHTEPGLETDEVPPLDIITISHNHRDHLDGPTLKAFLDHNPVVLVPMGDGPLVRSLGFKKVQELSWFETVSFTKNGKRLSITSVPADHWSSRGVDDMNHSLAQGWFINPDNVAGSIYVAGDTSLLGDERLKSIAYLVYQAYKNKGNKTAKLLNCEPGGPNYRRRDMESTHQSCIDSIISAFRLAKFLKDLEVSDEKPSLKPKTCVEWLITIDTIFMHHNKFELGTDRFNENMKIYKKMLKLLSLPEAKIQEGLTREQNKFYWELMSFNGDKAFIYEHTLRLLDIAGEVYNYGEINSSLTDHQKQELIQFLSSSIYFPKIGKKMEYR